jgi:hypothetical protein
VKRYGSADAIIGPVALTIRFGWFKDRLSILPHRISGRRNRSARFAAGSQTVDIGSRRPIRAPSRARTDISLDNYSWTSGAHSVKFGVDFRQQD